MNLHRRRYRAYAARRRRKAALPVLSDRQIAALVVGQTRDMIAVLDLQGIFRYASPAFQRVLGHDPAQLVGQNAFGLIHPADLSQIQAYIAALSSAGEALVTLRYAHADGSWRWLEAQAQTITVEGRTHLLGVARDVSERRAVEQALRESEERFRRLAEAGFEGIVINDQGQHIDVNAAFATMLGYSQEEASRMHALDFLAPECHSYVLSQIRRGAEEPYEAVGRRKDGSTFPCEIRGRNVPYGGRMLRVTAIRDISERKQAEFEQRFLAEASALLATSLDYEETLEQIARLCVPVLADWCVFDLRADDGTVQRVAAAHVDPAKAPLVHELQRRFPLDPNGPHPAMRVLRTGQPVLVPVATRADIAEATQSAEHLALVQTLGMDSYMSVSLSIQGQVIGVLSLVSGGSGRCFSPANLALAQDLANRAALAIENARLYRQAQSAVKIRDIFLSVAAHELKTPLTSLLGQAQLLQRRAQREGNLSERDQRSIGVIADQAQRLNKLVTALLDIGRLESGQLSIERTLIDVTELVRRVIEETQPTLPNHALVFEPTDTPLAVEGDAVRLEQVLSNLISNAAKYSSPGHAIRICCRARQKQAMIDVIDQGIGIPEQALPQLFTRFFRADNVDERRVSGLGVGLYVVREIVSLHGGTIEVESHEGEGSRFTVILPLA